MITPNKSRILCHVPEVIEETANVVATKQNVFSIKTTEPVR